MAKTIIEKLNQHFDESEIEWRPQSQGVNGDKAWIVVIPYIQARAIQKRLDDVFGFDGWQVEYRTDNTSNIICRLSVKTENGWIFKEDGATETHIEAFKGGISSALKRVAASGYGIGRYLYDLKPQYADCTLTKRADWNKSKDTKTQKIIYWKTPKLAKCEKITEPVAQTEPEMDVDFELILGIDTCNTISELNAYFKQYQLKAQNKENFIAKCAERKQVINANN
jgi:hypothetical protein